MCIITAQKVPSINEFYIYNLILLINNEIYNTSKLGMFSINKEITCEIVDMGLVKLHIWKEVS
jgi:hypothetical protein